MPLLAYLCLKINALEIRLMIVAFLARCALRGKLRRHARLSVGDRATVHSFLEMIPLMAGGSSSFSTRRSLFPTGRSFLRSSGFGEQAARF